MNDEIINYQDIVQRQTLFMQWLDVAVGTQFFSILYFATGVVLFLSLMIASKEPVV